MSDIGQALFKQTMDEVDHLFGKILDGNQNGNDVVKYNILKDLVADWARKLATYDKFKLKLTQQEDVDAR